MSRNAHPDVQFFGAHIMDSHPLDALDIAQCIALAYEGGYPYDLSVTWQFARQATIVWC